MTTSFVQIFGQPHLQGIGTILFCCRCARGSSANLVEWLSCLPPCHLNYCFVMLVDCSVAACKGDIMISMALLSRAGVTCWLIIADVIETYCQPDKFPASPMRHARVLRLLLVM